MNEVPGKTPRSKREARLHHAEHKGGKLEGSLQQRTIKEFLDKIKSRKNSRENTGSLVHQPDRRGAQEDLRGVTEENI